MGSSVDREWKAVGVEVQEGRGGPSRDLEPDCFRQPNSPVGPVLGLDRDWVLGGHRLQGYSFSLRCDRVWT